jgi:hypothetical protein
MLPLKTELTRKTYPSVDLWKKKKKEEKKKKKTKTKKKKIPENVEKHCQDNQKRMSE